MTIAEIQAVMRQAGWPENAIVKGAAIAYYESAHGNPRAGKVDSIESSYGLFQINLGLPGSAIRRERASWGPPERLYDPLYNARLALQLYDQANGWSPWRTTAILQPSRYLQYMPASQAAYNASVGSGNGNGNSTSEGNDPVVYVPNDQTSTLPDPANAELAAGLSVTAAALLIGGAVLAIYLISD